MTGTPPEARTEYSRGLTPPRAGVSADGAALEDRGSGRSGGSRDDLGDGISTAIVVVALLGALLLAVAEFTTLYTVHTSAGTAAGKAVSTGSHHSYALLPVVLLVLVLAYGVRVAGSRPALLAIGFMGVIALLIALLGDLPDAHASGLIGGGSVRYVAASAKPSAGFYMETGGALLLLVSCVCGFLLIGPPRRRPSSAAGQPGRARDADGGVTPPARERPLSES